MEHAKSESGFSGTWRAPQVTGLCAPAASAGTAAGDIVMIIVSPVDTAPILAEDVTGKLCGAAPRAPPRRKLEKIQ